MASPVAHRSVSKKLRQSIGTLDSPALMRSPADSSKRQQRTPRSPASVRATPKKRLLAFSPLPSWGDAPNCVDEGGVSTVAQAAPLPLERENARRNAPTSARKSLAAASNGDGRLSDVGQPRAIGRASGLGLTDEFEPTLSTRKAPSLGVSGPKNRLGVPPPQSPLPRKLRGKPRRKSRGSVTPAARRKSIIAALSDSDYEDGPDLSPVQNSSARQEGDEAKTPAPAPGEGHAVALAFAVPAIATAEVPAAVSPSPAARAPAVAALLVTPLPPSPPAAPSELSPLPPIFAAIEDNPPATETSPVHLPEASSSPAGLPSATRQLSPESRSGYERLREAQRVVSEKAAALHAYLHNDKTVPAIGPAMENSECESKESQEEDVHAVVEVETEAEDKDDDGTQMESIEAKVLENGPTSKDVEDDGSESDAEDAAVDGSKHDLVITAVLPALAPPLLQPCPQPESEAARAPKRVAVEFIASPKSVAGAASPAKSPRNRQSPVRVSAAQPTPLPPRSELEQARRRFQLISIVLATNSEAWTDRNERLRELEQFCEATRLPAKELAEAFSSLVPSLEVQLRDRRSLLVQTAVQALIAAAKVMQSHAHELACHVWPAVCKLCQSSIQVIANAGDRAMKALAAHVQSEFLTRVIESASKDKSAAVSLRCTESLEIVLGTHAEAFLEASLETGETLLGLSITSLQNYLLCHASPLVRKAARGCVRQVMRRWPARGDQLLDTVEASQRQLIVQELDSAAKQERQREAARKRTQQLVAWKKEREERAKQLTGGPSPKLPQRTETAQSRKTLMQSPTMRKAAVEDLESQPVIVVRLQQSPKSPKSPKDVKTVPHPCFELKQPDSASDGGSPTKQMELVPSPERVLGPATLRSAPQTPVNQGALHTAALQVADAMSGSTEATESSDGQISGQHRLAEIETSRVISPVRGPLASPTPSSVPRCPSQEQEFCPDAKPVLMSPLPAELLADALPTSPQASAHKGASPALVQSSKQQDSPVQQRTSMEALAPPARDPSESFESGSERSTIIHPSPTHSEQRNASSNAPASPSMSAASPLPSRFEASPPRSPAPCPAHSVAHSPLPNKASAASSSSCSSSPAAKSPSVATCCPSDTPSPQGAPVAAAQRPNASPDVQIADCSDSEESGFGASPVRAAPASSSSSFVYFDPPPSKACAPHSAALPARTLFSPPQDSEPKLGARPQHGGASPRDALGGEPVPSPSPPPSLDHLVAQMREINSVAVVADLSKKMAEANAMSAVSALSSQLEQLGVGAPVEAQEIEKRNVQDSKAPVEEAGKPPRRAPSLDVDEIIRAGFEDEMAPNLALREKTPSLPQQPIARRKKPSTIVKPVRMESSEPATRASPLWTLLLIAISVTVGLVPLAHVLLTGRGSRGVALPSEEPKSEISATQEPHRTAPIARLCAPPKSQRLEWLLLRPSATFEPEILADLDLAVASQAGSDCAENAAASGHDEVHLACTEAERPPIHGTDNGTCAVLLLPKASLEQAGDEASNILTKNIPVALEEHEEELVYVADEPEVPQARDDDLLSALLSNAVAVLFSEKEAQRNVGEQALVAFSCEAEPENAQQARDVRAEAASSEPAETVRKRKPSRTDHAFNPICPVSATGDQMSELTILHVTEAPAAPSAAQTPVLVPSSGQDKAHRPATKPATAQPLSSAFFTIVAVSMIALIASAMLTPAPATEAAAGSNLVVPEPSAHIGSAAPHTMQPTPLRPTQSADEVGRTPRRTSASRLFFSKLEPVSVDAVVAAPTPRRSARIRSHLTPLRE